MTQRNLAAFTVAKMMHAGQTDKAGRPYIEHVERVACSSFIQSNGAQQAAFLHDVIEDTPCEAIDLSNLGFNDLVIEAVLLLSKCESATYVEYIDSIVEAVRSGRPGATWALEVKLADLHDHLRGPTSDVLTASMRARYLKAEQKLRPLWKQAA